VDFNSIAWAASVLAVRWLTPPTVVLVAMLISWLVFLFRAQRSGRIDLIDTLRGDDGKGSEVRVVYYAAWAVMSWALMEYAVVKGDDPRYLVELFIGYGVIFILPKVAEKWLEARYSNIRKDGDPHV